MRQPYRLESITLRDVGVFENTHFDFPPIKSAEADAEKAEIHIFTGPNGCGKSTLLYALAAVFDAPLDQPKSDHLKGRFKNKSSSIKYIFNENAGSLTNQPNNFFPEKDINPKLPADVWQYHLQTTLGLTTCLEFGVFAYSGQSSSADKFDVSVIEEITDSPFDKALSFNSTVRPKTIAQWIALNRSNAALALQDGALEEIKRYDLALERISAFIKSVCDLNVSFRLERNPRSVSLIIDKGRDTLKCKIIPFDFFQSAILQS